MGGRATAIDIPLLKIGTEYCRDGIFLYNPVSPLMAVLICTLLDRRCAWSMVCKLYSIMLITDDEVAEKILHTDNLPKHLPTYDFMLPIIGKTSLVTVSGDYWRKVRKMFSPAFATSHLETLVPGMVEEALVFVDVLKEAAKKNKVLRLGERLPALTMDVIAR
jgi:cytochrome P450